MKNFLPKKYRFGFTLIELLVTLAIIGVLSAGVVSLIGLGPQKQSRDARRKADLERIASALEIYRSDNSGYPNNWSLLVPNYISVIPSEPVTGRAAYQYAPTSCTTTCRAYTLCADLEQTAQACPSDYIVRNP